MKIRLIICLFCLTLAPLFGTGTHPKLANHTLIPKRNAEEHYQMGIAALDAKKWQEAIKHFSTLFYNYPDSSNLNLAHFYIGIAYYHVSEFDTASTAFTNYLQGDSSPEFFQEALDYKFAIAENFRNGAKRHVLDSKQLPKWASGKEEAVAVYDEIIASIPNHDMAVKALHAKGHTLWSMRDFQSGVDAFRLLIRRYHLHELAPESYVAIMKLYLDQSQREPHNHDILPLAQINLARFQQDFPRDERIQNAENDLLAIKETYAKGFYETGQFYERISQPKAAFIYYQSALKQFPETTVAGLCRDRLDERFSRRPEE